MQLTHTNSNFLKKSNPITLVCDAVNSPANIGSLFRVADAFSIEKIVFGGCKVDLNSNRLKRTARSTHNWVTMEDNVDIISYLQQVKNKGYEITALEITKESKALSNFTFSKNKKNVLVLGEESLGVSKQVLSLCDNHVHIEMFGENSSMNVSQAATVALYEITKQLNN